MSLEKQAKSTRRRYVFEQAILTALKLGTMIGLAVFMPNSMKILELLGWVPGKKNAKYILGDALERLQQKGMIITDKERKLFKITNKGKTYLWRLDSKYIAIEKPKKWDKKWRLIIFDIKESDRFQRDAVRTMLQNIGCVRLQNSVWVYPYDCEEVVSLLKTKYKIGEEVLYIIAEKVEGDEWMKKHFKL